MNQNRISQSFSATEKTQTTASLNAFIALVMPKLIALSPDERRSLSKIGDGSIPFGEKVAQYTVSNPEFNPMFSEPDEFRKDFALFTDLREFVRLIEQLKSNLEDTIALSGSEADDFARRYYGAVGEAAKMGVPNAQAIYDDLRERYESLRVKRPRAAKAEPEDK